MPLLTKMAGDINTVVGAEPGYSVLITAPAGSDVAGVPGGGAVVAWVLVADDEAAGGARVDPVFLSAGRAWTPDQFRAAYGQQLGVQVGRER